MFLFVAALHNLAETLKLRKKFQPAEAVLRESLEYTSECLGIITNKLLQVSLQCCVGCGVAYMGEN